MVLQRTIDASKEPLFLKVYLSLVVCLSEFINPLKPDTQAREDNGVQLPATYTPFLVSSPPPA